MKLVSVAEMRAVEEQGRARGVSEAQMMEHAGANLGRFAHSHMELGEVLGLVGSGNNGGDTLIALECLAQLGHPVWAYLARPRPREDPLVRRLEAAGGVILPAGEDPGFEQLATAVRTCRLLLDGVFGTGARLPLNAEVALVLEAAQRAIAGDPNPPRVFAVDCPSGVDCDSGAAAPQALAAERTVCMAAVKRGLVLEPAAGLVGELAVVGIGLPADLPAWSSIRRTVVTAEPVRAALPPRPRTAHKGTFGAALIAAGSLNYTGAALLAGKAAFRAGAGWVTLAVPAPLHLALAGHFPEATWVLLPHEQGVIAQDAARVLRSNLERPTALLLGPGWDTELTTRRFLEDLLRPAPQPHRRPAIGLLPADQGGEPLAEKVLPPLVIDADGLNCLSQIENWPALLPASTVLTPHPGELARLTGKAVADLQADRIATAEEFARAWNAVLVFKGANTVIASPQGETAVIPVATPALARAGTGDVLAGLITGLLAQGMPPYPAAWAGAWLHAQAGLRAERALWSSAAVLAGDVLAAVPSILAELVA